MEAETFERFRRDFLSDWQKTAQRFVGLQVLGLTARRSILAALRNHSYLNAENQELALTALSWLVLLDNRDAYRRLEIPQCHVLGKEDALVPQSAAREIAAILNPEVESEFHCIEQAGHLPHIACPQKLAPIIDSFLRKIDARHLRDRDEIARSFSKAAEHYDNHAILQKEVAKELVAWSGGLEGRLLDLGCGTGFVAEEIDKTQSIVEYFGLDLSLRMVDVAASKPTVPRLNHWICADMERLPIADASLDSLTSSLAIQWLEDIKLQFEEARRVLKSGGKFALATLGPATLRELRDAWSRAAPEHIHVNEFLSVEALIDASERAGLELELCRIDRKVLEYSSVVDLMKALKGIGAHNVNRGRNIGMTGTKTLNRVQSNYEQYRLNNGCFPATYEVIYLVFTAE
jgi:malonyl-CoA O-methyltransferase